MPFFSSFGRKWAYLFHAYFPSRHFVYWYTGHKKERFYTFGKPKKNLEISNRIDTLTNASCNNVLSNFKKVDRKSIGTMSASSLFFIQTSINGLFVYIDTIPYLPVAAISVVQAMQRNRKIHIQPLFRLPCSAF